MIISSTFVQLLWFLNFYNIAIYLFQEREKFDTFLEFYKTLNFDILDKNIHISMILYEIEWRLNWWFLKISNY